MCCVFVVVVCFYRGMVSFFVCVVCVCLLFLFVFIGGGFLFFVCVCLLLLFVFIGGWFLFSGTFLYIHTLGSSQIYT